MESLDENEQILGKKLFQKKLNIYGLYTETWLASECFR